MLPGERDLSPNLIGSAIRTIRVHRGIKLEDLASAAKISPSYLSLIEQGQRRLTRRVEQNITKELGIKPDALLKLSQDIGQIIERFSDTDFKAEVASLEAALEATKNDLEQLQGFSSSGSQ